MKGGEEGIEEQILEILNRIADSLEKIETQLADILDKVSWIETNTSGTESELGDISREVKDIKNKF